MAGLLLTGYGAYDPEAVTLLIGGYAPTGFAADTKITITKAAELIAPYVGVDGDVSLAIDRNTIGTMSIHLQNTSPSNVVIAAFARVASTTGVVAFPVMLIDPQGAKMVTNGWIQSQPEMTVGSTVGVMSWVIGLQDARLLFSDDITASDNISGVTIS